MILIVPLLPRSWTYTLLSLLCLKSLICLSSLQNLIMHMMVRRASPCMFAMLRQCYSEDFWHREWHVLMTQQHWQNYLRSFGHSSEQCDDNGAQARTSTQSHPFCRPHTNVCMRLSCSYNDSCVYNSMLLTARDLCTCDTCSCAAFLIWQKYFCCCVRQIVCDLPFIGDVCYTAEGCYTKCVCI